MIVREEISLVFALSSIVAVCGCGSEAVVPNTSGLPIEQQRLQPKGVAQLAQSVEAAGGRTVLRPDSKMVLVRFEGGSLDDAQLGELEHLEFATGFNAPGAKITDAGLEQIATAGQRIETLDLTGNAITDAGLVHLQQMPKLKFVVLDDTQVTAAGVDDLQSAMPSLNVGFFQ